MYDIPILMLHTINNDAQSNPMGALAVSAKGFENYLKVFASWNYQMISMDDLIQKRYDPNRNFVVLTFDDGYKDNLTVAMPILKKYGAHATIFVNPDYVSPVSDPQSDWGFMTWDEIKAAEKTGVFDIQAHTMTHEFIFTEDEIVDYYTPDKFNKYYWIAWMLYPDSPRKWDSSAMEYKNRIPVGYPIFKYNRRISAKKFTPSKEYVEHLISAYQGKVEAEPYSGIHGIYETEEQYRKYVEWEIIDCKRILEEKLHKTIHTLCFPGGGYTDFALQCAVDNGYRCYMTASKMRVGNNNDHLKTLYDHQFCGLNRTSFSRIHPGVLPDSIFDYWIAKLSLGTYQNMKGYAVLKKMLSKVLHA